MTGLGRPTRIVMALGLFVAGCSAGSDGPSVAAHPCRPLTDVAAKYSAGEFNARAISQAPLSLSRQVGLSAFGRSGQAVTTHSAVAPITRLTLMHSPSSDPVSETDLVIALTPRGEATFLGCFNLNAGQDPAELTITDPAPGSPLALLVIPVLLSGEPYQQANRAQTAVIESDNEPVVFPSGPSGLANILFPSLRENEVVIEADNSAKCPSNCLPAIVKVLDLDLGTSATRAEVTFTTVTHIDIGKPRTFPLPAPAGRTLRLALTMSGAASNDMFGFAAWRAEW